MQLETRQVAVRYPLSMRVLHWIRAVLILGMIASGLYMTSFPQNAVPPVIYAVFYPNHKQFGILVWLLAIVHQAIRWRNRKYLPHTPQNLKAWERSLSHVVHRLIMALTLITPLLGYSLSSTYTQSDGVPFFFFGQLPELLPKNDHAFAVFDALHKYCAYILLALVLLHVAGAVKHRLQDKGGETDVLPRML